MKLTLTALFLLLLSVSCQKVETPVDESNTDLIGSWINPQYTDNLVTYSRATNLVKNQFGIIFKSDNKLVERQLNGWCGTPPITTADYEGTWTKNDSIVNITVGYWGGTAQYTWKIVTLNKQKLVISVVTTSFGEGK